MIHFLYQCKFFIQKMYKNFNIALKLEKTTANNIHIDTGQRLRLAREALGFFSQAAFGDAISINRAAIGHVESGLRLPSKKLRNALEEKYKVNINWLLTGKGPMFLETRSLEAFRKLPESVLDVRVIKSWHELQVDEYGLNAGDTVCSGMNDEPVDTVSPGKLYIVNLVGGGSELSELRQLRSGDYIKVVDGEDSGVYKQADVDSIYEVKFFIRKV